MQKLRDREVTSMSKVTQLINNGAGVMTRQQFSGVYLKAKDNSLSTSINKAYVLMR